MAANSKVFVIAEVLFQRKWWAVPLHSQMPLWWSDGDLQKILRYTGHFDVQVSRTVNTNSVEDTYEETFVVQIISL